VTGNYEMLSMFLDTGLRLGEPVALDVNDIDVGSAVIRVRNGKGSNECYVHAVGGSCACLRDWIDVRPHTQVDVALSTPHAGRRLDKRSVAWMTERTARSARPDGGRVLWCMGGLYRSTRPGLW